ncbi:MAG TPA: hypothetical protein VER96_20545 [Polyangiaceae bacterium]|nr:hypothetical protein [Polyangiaceae bacterium]
MRHRYPFESLHWLRGQRVDRQAKLLGESRARAARAQSDAERAEASRRSTELAVAELATAERARLDEGLVRAFDLEVVAGWQKGAALELAAKAELERRARESHATAAAAELAARRALSTASNEAKIIDRHRDDFRAQRAAEQERSEEEAATEQWTASHFSPRRS